MSTDSSCGSSDTGALVRPILVSDESRSLLREAVDSSCLELERRHGYVRPRRFLPGGQKCILKDLGECGDRKCGNYRLGKYAAVRPDFLKFCVDHIKAFCSKAGLVYCSLGSGQLLFDWELLEHLTQKEGMHVRAIHLIDIAYGGAKHRASAVRAQRVFAGWFQERAWEKGEKGQKGRGCGEACPVRSFLSASDFQSWVARTGESVDVLLDCDAVSARKKMDVDKFRLSVLRAGGVCLVLSNPAKRIAIHKPPGNGTADTVGLRELVQQVYRRGAWHSRASVSHERSRSRRQKRRCSSTEEEESQLPRRRKQRRRRMSVD